MCNSSSSLQWLASWTCVGILLWCAANGLASAEDPIKAARLQLYVNRDQSLLILEAAVEQSPARVDYWVELISALEGFRGNDLLADCTSRVALKLHPNAPGLLLARASLLWLAPLQAIEIFDTLEKITGHESEAIDAKELIALGIRVPASWDDFRCEERASWVKRLIASDRWQWADQVLRRALALFPKDDELASCQAIVLAEHGQFEEAFRAQSIGRRRKSVGFGKYWCLGDLLLLKGHAELAIKSFGPDYVDEQLTEDRDETRGSRRQLILAEALLVTGGDERADALLQQYPDGEAELLKIESLVKKEKTDDARTLGKKLIVKWMNDDDANRLPDLTFQEDWPISLVARLQAAVRWLTAEFGPEKTLIERHIGQSEALFKVRSQEPRGWKSVLEVKKQIAAAMPWEPGSDLAWVT